MLRLLLIQLADRSSDFTIPAPKPYLNFPLSVVRAVCKDNIEAHPDKKTTSIARIAKLKFYL